MSIRDNLLRGRGQQRPYLGTVGYGALFLWCVGLVLLIPPEGLPIFAILGLGVGMAFFPRAMRQLLRWQWLFFFLVLILPSALWMGEIDRTFLGISYSSTGLQVGFYMVMRALVMLIAVIGFSSSVDVSELAALLERFGLRGLGFSMGVAVNLLPTMMQSAQTAWHALRMRGGFRRQRWNALRLLFVTIVSNALRRAEEIALSAEVRAFRPERARSLAIKKGAFDGIVLGVALCSLIALGVLF
jgi:energy-coupling factor transporter transmembrane protein EcfT